MGLSDLVTTSLQVVIVALLEVFLKLVWIMPVTDAQVDDLTGDFGSCKVECRSAVELNVLGGIILACIEHVALDIENLHGKPARLRNAVLACVNMVVLRAVCRCSHVKSRVTGFGAVPAGDRILAALSKELTLLEVLGQVMVHKKFTFDNTVSTCMCSTVAVPMHVPLGLLNAVDLFSDSINVLFFALGDLLYPFGIPANIVSLGQVSKGGAIGSVAVCPGSRMNGEAGCSVRKGLCCHVEQPVLFLLPDPTIGTHKAPNNGL